MKYIKTNLTSILLVIFLFTGCSDAPDSPDTLVTEGYDQFEMDAAIERARSETTDFIEVLKSGDADSFSVKAPITEGKETEHFWITDVTYKDGIFTGLIGNDPGIVSNVTYGQEWKVAESEISDWMYIRGEMMHGGYTIDPLLPTWDPEQAEELRKRLVR